MLQRQISVYLLTLNDPYLPAPTHKIFVRREDAFHYLCDEVRGPKSSSYFEELNKFGHFEQAMSTWEKETAGDRDRLTYTVERLPVVSYTKTP